MLTEQMNERLTQVGPGTPMGTLLRYYWYPIAGSSQLDINPVLKVRVLGEDLVLYRDRSGNLGLIDEPCPHRRVSMEYGIPEPEGLRCPYHGWVFNQEGRCLEQPAEPWDSTFKDRVTTKAYKVQELGGLIFAYLGDEPAPLLPRYDLLVWDNVVRQIGVTVLPCNFVQCMENALDPTHAEWLHGYYMNYLWSERKAELPPRGTPRHKKIGFDRFEHGIIKRRVVEGTDEEDEAWKVGHPTIFPWINRLGSSGHYMFQYRWPIDDTHTLHIDYAVFRPGISVPAQESVPVYEIPCQDEDGKFMTEVVLQQDFFAWASQGPIAERDKEHLGQSDIGVIMFRELLFEQLERVERGEDPMEVYRDPDKNACIELFQEEHFGTRGSRQGPPGGPRGGRRSRFTEAGLKQNSLKFSPMVNTLRDLFEEAEERASKGEVLLPAPPRPDYSVDGTQHREVYVRFKPE